MTTKNVWKHYEKYLTGTYKRKDQSLRWQILKSVFKGW